MSQRATRASNGLTESAHNRVKQLRLELGLTRVALARMADLSDKTLDRLERGSKDLRETTCRKILNALNRARAKESLAALTYAELFSGKTTAKEND